MFMVNRAKVASLAFALVCIVTPRAAAAQESDAVDAVIAAQPVADAPAAVDWEVAAEGPVRMLTGWVIASGDNHGAPFIIIDKTIAKVFVFDGQGQLAGATPALVGIATGDDSAPGVGERKLSAISRNDRTTPAGRFIAKIGTASGNHEVLWVDYANSISLHPVVTANKRERRLQRLASPTPEDNRITYGCINVPASFYGNVVRPLFKKDAGVVYILPETKPLGEVFQAFRAPPQPSSLVEISR